METLAKRLRGYGATSDEDVGAPAYLYLSNIHLSHIHYTLRCVHRARGDIALLREEGEGTADATLLEKVASGTVVVHREAVKAWNQKVEEIVGKGKDKSHKLDDTAKEKLDPQQREWALHFYVGKMKVMLRDAEDGAVEKEMKEIKKDLKRTFREKATMTRMEVEETVEDEEGW